MALTTELKYAAMTAAIDRIKSPNRFITDLLYSNRSPQSTEQIEIDTWVRGRQMAPFVTLNSEAVPVQGTTQTRAVVSAPNIRVRRDLRPHEFMWERTPGNVIFASRGSQEAAIREHIAKELEPLRFDIDNRIEWMCAQTLTGTLTYNPASDNFQGDAFVIDFQRPAGYAANAIGAWDSPANVDIVGDIRAAQRQGETEGIRYTDAIMSAATADELYAYLETTDAAGLREQMNRDSNFRNVATIDLATKYSDAGVQYIGKIAGVDFWEYNRTALDYDGATSVQMIEDGKVQFVSRGAASDFVLYFGAIPDWDALEGRSWVGEVFAKSEIKADPSVMTAIAHSRPLPVPRRPEATYTLTV